MTEDIKRLVEGPRYLRDAEQVEAMTIFYSPDEPAPLTHTVWTGDFMCLAKHNVPCPICFSAHAQLERNVTPGQWSQQFGPCAACEAQGWETRQRPRNVATLTALKWTGTAFQVAGVFLMSGRIGATWCAFAVMLVGSVIWVGSAARTRDWAAMALNLAFTASNLLGIWRWLA